MGTVLTMSDLTQGQSATVTQVNIGGAIRRRLQDIGLVVGTKVECVARGMFADPAAYLIRGALIALRKDEASLISVKS